MKHALLFGCGSTREKLIQADVDDGPQWEGYEVTTLDSNPAHRPDVLHDLNVLPLPFPDNAFDRVDGYQVLEHLGSGPGDWEHFFAEFNEWHRVLKPGGVFAAAVPKWNSPWAWGDPSHRRVICFETLTFLSQRAYVEQVGITAMSDFRGVYTGDFELLWSDTRGESFYFLLRAIK